MRFTSSSLFVAVLLGVAHAAAEEPSRSSKPPPDAVRLRLLGEDLRYGAWSLDAGGGVWVPSASFVPVGVGLTAPAVGAEARLRLGWGLNGFLVAFAEGGFARAGGKTGCVACSTTSVSVGLGLAAHLTQGFAVDPWIAYGAGYRDTLLSVDPQPFAASDAPVHGIDFARVTMGFEHAPVSWLGVGPYLGTNVGVRLFDGVAYADFVAGLRITLGPMGRSAKLTVDSAR